MTNISVNGLEISLKASITFPQGTPITAFADDSDPFDIPELQIADTGMGANGDLVVFSTPNPIEVSVSVIPNSDDDKNLAFLYEQNRAGKNKKSVKDVITMTGIYPDDSKITLTNGALVSGMPGNAASSAGRLKSKTYTFRFENRS